MLPSMKSCISHHLGTTPEPPNVLGQQCSAALWKMMRIFLKTGMMTCYWSSARSPYHFHLFFHIPFGNSGHGFFAHLMPATIETKTYSPLKSIVDNLLWQPLHTPFLLSLHIFPILLEPFSPSWTLYICPHISAAFSLVAATAHFGTDLVPPTD